MTREEIERLAEDFIYAATSGATPRKGNYFVADFAIEIANRMNEECAALVQGEIHVAAIRALKVK